MSEAMPLLKYDARFADCKARNKRMQKDSNPTRNVILKSKGAAEFSATPLIRISQSPRIGLLIRSQTELP